MILYLPILPLLICQYCLYCSGGKRPCYSFKISPTEVGNVRNVSLRHDYLLHIRFSVLVNSKLLKNNFTVGFFHGSFCNNSPFTVTIDFAQAPVMLPKAQHIISDIILHSSASVQCKTAAISPSMIEKHLLTGDSHLFPGTCQLSAAISFSRRSCRVSFGPFPMRIRGDHVYFWSV